MHVRDIISIILILAVLGPLSPASLVSSSDDGIVITELVGHHYLIIRQVSSTLMSGLTSYVLGGYIEFFIYTIELSTGKLPDIEAHYPVALRHSNASRGYRFAIVNITCISCGGVELRIMVADAHIAVFKAFVNNTRFRRLGEGFAQILEQAIWSIHYRGVSNISVVYGGVHASEIIYTDNITGIEEEYNGDVYIVNKTNGYIVYVHPYEKYYVYLEGIRNIYPIVVRGAYENETGGLPFTYMFSGLMIPRETSTTVTKRTYSEENIEAVTSAYNSFIHDNGIDSNTYTADQLIVYDHFLAPYKSGEFYAYTPMLVVGALYSTAYMWAQLTPSGEIRILGGGVLLGGYQRSDPHIDLDSIFTPIQETTGSETNESVGDTDNPPPQATNETNTPDQTMLDNNESATNANTSADTNTSMDTSCSTSPRQNTTSTSCSAPYNTSTSKNTANREPLSLISTSIGILIGFILGISISMIFRKKA